MSHATLERRVGEFTVHEALGQGGMASVFRATHHTGQVVALKVMDPRLAADPAFVARFQREARISASLQHPHIVRVFGFGEADGLHFLASELVSGGTLERLTTRGHKVPSAVAIEFIAQLLEGLAHAHSKGVVHRDLKPANLLLTPDGQIKVTDFGIARAVDETNLTQTGAVFGTARYMSPEQIRGATVDQRSDLFTTGIILYELLGGEAPGGSEGPEVSMARALAKAFRPLLELNPMVPAALVRVVEQLMAWDPAERFPSAEAALKALTPMRDAARLAHRSLVAEYVAGTDAMDAKLKHTEATGLVARARAALAQQPPVLEAAALNVHLALELDPGLEEARTLKAQLGERVSFKVDESQNPRVRELEAHLAANPDDAQLLSQLTQLYRTEGNFLRAAQCMRRYVALRPDDTYMGAQLARLAGDDWVPTVPVRKRDTHLTLARPKPSSPAARTGASHGMAASPMAPAPEPSAAGAPVVVYEPKSSGFSPGPWLAWIVVLGLLGLGYLGVRTGIRSLERAEEARFKAQEIEAQRAAAALLEQQRRLEERIAPPQEPPSPRD